MPKLWPIIHFPQVNVVVPSGLKLLTFTRKVSFVVERIHSEKKQKGSEPWSEQKWKKYCLDTVTPDVHVAKMKVVFVKRNLPILTLTLLVRCFDQQALEYNI